LGFIRTDSWRQHHEELTATYRRLRQSPSTRLLALFVSESDSERAPAVLTMCIACQKRYRHPEASGSSTANWMYSWLFHEILGFRPSFHRSATPTLRFRLRLLRPPNRVTDAMYHRALAMKVTLFAVSSMTRLNGVRGSCNSDEQTRRRYPRIV